MSRGHNRSRRSISRGVEFVSAYTTSTDIINCMIREAERQGGDPGQVISFLATSDADPLWVDFIHSAIGASKEMIVTETSVNYGRSLREGMGLAGVVEFDPDITERHFPLNGETGKKRRKFELCPLDSPQVSYDDALKQLKKSGLLPATIRELIAFLVANRGIQWQFSIVALGSTWNGDPEDDDLLVPCSDMSESGLVVDLDSCKLGWEKEDCRLLGVKIDNRTTIPRV